MTTGRQRGAADNPGLQKGLPKGLSEHVLINMDPNPSDAQAERQNFMILVFYDLILEIRCSSVLQPMKISRS